MLRYDFLAALVVFFIWAALPGGILHQDRSSMVYNIHKLPTNVAEARYIHITYKDRKSNDNLIVRR
jgi:hypothetical protein